MSLAVSFLSLDFLRFGVLGWLLIFGWASLLVEHSGCLLHLDQNLLSLDGGFLNFVLDLGLFVEELLGFSELDLFDGLLNFGDMGLGFLKDLLLLDLALLEPMVMLGKDIFGLDRKLRFLNLAIFLSFFELLTLPLGFLDDRVGDLSSLLFSDLKLGVPDFGVLGDVLLVPLLSPLLGLRELMSLHESDWVLFGELLFSDLLGFLKLHLKLLEGWRSGLSFGLLKSELDGVGILWRRGDIVDWDLKGDRFWRIHHGELCFGCEKYL